VFAINAAEPYSDETDKTGGETIAPMVVTGPTRAIHRNRAWMEKRGIGAFTFHDLRRTGASHMPRLGVSRAHVSMVLNHAQRGMTAEVYDWYEYLNEKRVALDTWAQRIERLVSCEIEPDDIEVEAVEMEEEEAD
jgi:integrase